MTQQQQEDSWLCSVLPVKGSKEQGCHTQIVLELHKRLVHLASLREAVLSQLSQLDGVKAALTEKKVLQQGRLLAALDARLAAALAAVDPHRCAAWDLIKALEQEAAFYSDVLQGLEPGPPAEQWTSRTEGYQRLQQQVAQQEQSVQPDKLQQALSARLQPCQVAHVEVVEQLRAQVDSLQQQLSAGQQQPQQQYGLCIQELSTLQQLASLVLQQVSTYVGLQKAQQQQQHGQALDNLGEAAEAALACQLHKASNNDSHHLLMQCQRLKQQLQQLSEAADALVQCPATGSCGSRLPAVATVDDDKDCCQEPLDTGLQDPQNSSSWDPLSSVQDTDAAGKQQGEALQAPHQQQQQASVRLHHCLWPARTNSSNTVPQGQPETQLQVVKLRLAYQQMLHKVQGRYQQEVRKLEAKHQEALQAQAHNHQQVLADLAKQHQELCARLAATATTEVELQQQLLRLNADKQALQQQVDKLQSEVAAAAANALAVAQVQHEQQVMEAKAAQQQLLQEARQQTQQLQQQVQELQQQLLKQQQAPAVPSAELVAALVREAAAAQAAQQQEQLREVEGTYQAALQQRDQQHDSLLKELAGLKQLQEESLVLSVSSAGTSITAAGAVPAVAAAAAAHHLDGPAAICGVSGVQPAGPIGGGPVASSSSALDALVAPRLGDSTPDQVAPQHGGTVDAGLVQQQLGLTKNSGGRDVMSDLIAAVLGPGPIGRAKQAAHKQSLAAQQQQQQWQQQHSQQAAVPGSSKETQAALDVLLGLQPCSTMSGAACEAAAGMGSSAAYSGRPIIAPANAALAAALERARVAETCKDALQDISSRSACNTGKQHSSSSSPPELRLPWKPASHGMQSPQQQQQQQWRHWQQHPTPRAAGSPRAGSRTPSPARQQHMQAEQLPVLTCVRCGQQEEPDLGPCTFHPALVAAPGPLLYGQEWHACRARCVPQMPGCYTRREHFFAPGMCGPLPRTAAAGAGSTTASPQPHMGAPLQQPISSRRQDVVASKNPCKATLSPAKAPAAAARGGSSGITPAPGALAASGPEPRSSVPKPSLWRR